MKNWRNILEKYSIGIYKSKGRYGFEFNLPDYYNEGNVNNCLMRIFVNYGPTKEGYSRIFEFTFIHPKGFGWPYIDTYRDHSRFFLGVGLFTLSFDWQNNKKLEDWTLKR